MKNLKKLSRENLKSINGGSAPVCEEGLNPCPHPRDADHKSLWWTCELQGYCN